MAAKGTPRPDTAKRGTKNEPLAEAFGNHSVEWFGPFVYCLKADGKDTIGA
jgi:hypothetical protein